MPSPLDTRLDREEGRRTAGAAEQSSAALRRRHIWRAEAAMGAVTRNALARLLTDAEIAEDHVEQVFDVDGAGDAAEAAQRETEVFPRATRATRRRTIAATMPQLLRAPGGDAPGSAPALRCGRFAQPARRAPSAICRYLRQSALRPATPRPVMPAVTDRYPPPARDRFCWRPGSCRLRAKPTRRRRPRDAPYRKQRGGFRLARLAAPLDRLPSCSIASALSRSPAVSASTTG